MGGCSEKAGSKAAKRTGLRVPRSGVGGCPGRVIGNFRNLPSNTISSTWNATVSERILSEHLSKEEQPRITVHGVALGTVPGEERLYSVSGLTG